MRQIFQTQKEPILWHLTETRVQVSTTKIKSQEQSIKGSWPEK